MHTAEGGGTEPSWVSGGPGVRTGVLTRRGERRRREMVWPPRRLRRGCGSHMPQNAKGGGTPRSAGGAGQRLPGLLEGPTLLTSWLQISCTERSRLSLPCVSLRQSEALQRKPCSTHSPHTQGSQGQIGELTIQTSLGRVSPQVRIWVLSSRASSSVT